jgi:hypothetical protein
MDQETRKAIAKALLKAASTLEGKIEQDNLLGYELPNEESFWLSQVAEGGGSPDKEDAQKAKKLKRKGKLRDVYPKGALVRDPALDQVQYLTYRGDVAQRAYQTYRARWAKTSEQD